MPDPTQQRFRRSPPLLLAGSAVLLCGCAAARPAADSPLGELRAQVAAQAELIAQQQRRIEQLEVRLATLVPRAAAPDRSDASASQGGPTATPPKQLRTVKLAPAPNGRRARPLRLNPVDRAPRLPSAVDLREPDEAALADLEQPVRPPVDAVLREAAGADFAFAAAVRELNEGAHAEARRDLLAFAEQHPRHPAADNALYLAALAQAASGDCRGALPLFDRVPARYPAGDAVPLALLEKGRCLARLSDSGAADALARVAHEFPGSMEATLARQLLDGLEARR